MNGLPKTEKELRREIYSLRRSLREDISIIKEARKNDFLIPKTALDRMAEAERIMRKKSVKNMNKGELQSMYRKLTHTRGLKSSTYGGAISQVENLTNLVPNIRELNRIQVEKMWSAYDKLVSEVGILKDFKYDVYTALADTISKTRLSTDELAIRVEDIYKKSIMGDLNENEYKGKTDKILIQSFNKILRKN